MSDLTDLNGDNPPPAWSEESAKQAHEALMAANQEALNVLAAQGFPLDSGTMLKMRVDYLTHILVGDDPETIYNFGIGWEQFLGKVLEGAQQAARMQTLQPNVPGQLVIPGA